MRLAQRLVIRYIRAKFRFLSSISKRKAAEKAFRLFCTPQSRNRKKLPPVFEKAERLKFPLEGSIVRGYRWNHPSPKKLLILHGFESSVINFDRYVHPLVKKGYEVLAFDAPAHGRSSGHTINVITYKNMVKHIMQEFGPVQAFIAHSFGGLSLSLALEETEHNDTDKIVMIAPAAETTRAIDNFFRFLRLDNSLRVEFDDIIEKMGGHSPSWYSVSRAASSIKAQVLFLQDKEDDLTPLKDVTPLIEKKLPNFRFVISEGLGHSRIYRDNQTVKTVMEFL